MYCSREYFKTSLNLDLIYSNYRPVSNLSFLSKLVERAVCQQLGDYISITNMSEKLQSAYKVAHSTETALIKVKNDILMSLDNKQVTCLILLDLSAAFDRVSHKLLLNRLKFLFGITGVVLKWLEEYLTGRHQQVVLGKGAEQVMSEKVTHKQGVPQGSVLGPILFTLYTSPLGDICRSDNVVFHSCADDQQNYMSFSPALQGSKDHCIQTLESCISDIRIWMRTNLLKLNDNKTKIILLGTRQQLGKVGQFEIKIGQDNISPAPTARNLGVVLNQEMKWTSHINRLSASLFVTICSIAHIWHQLNKETAKIIIQALVLSKLDYCNSVYHGAPKYSIAKLQRLQNMSARVVSNVKYCNHITPYLSDLHWLKVNERMVYKICTIMYKCVHGLAPEYLQNLVVRSHPRRLRSAENNRLPTIRCNTSMALHSAFSSTGPRTWNTLPQHIINCKDIESFKTKLKTFLFVESYGLRNNTTSNF